MSPPATPPARTGTWIRALVIRALVILADGSHVELRLASVVAGSVAGYTPEEREAPSLTVTRDGQRRRGRLTELLGG